MNTFWVICFMIVMIIITYLFNIEKDNMIKYFKYFLTIFVISLWIINFSNAWIYTWWSNRLAYQSVWDREYLDNYWFLVDEYSNFDTFYNSWTDLLVLYYPPYWWANGRQIYGWIDWKLYYYGDYNWWPRYKSQWFIKNFMKTTKQDLFDVNSSDNPYRNYHNNLTASEFYSLDLKFTNIYTMSTFGSQNALASLTFRTFCLEEENWEDIYCRSCNVHDNQWTDIYTCLSEIENSQNYNISDFDSLSSISFDFSPWGWSGPAYPDISYTWTFEDEIDSTIAYYEYRYNWNENMCYVWTNDLEHSLRYFIWQWVPYEYWTGATLYQLYYSIYSWFGNNKIRNLWSFINSWLINYQMVYDTIWEDDIRYVANYNWPDTNVTILYTWYTNELFLGNLGAIYNMASVLYNSYMQESTMWEEVAYYCDIKLNYQNYKNWTLSFTWLQDLVTPWIIERVGDYISRDMPWSTWYIQPDMWSWSIWNDIVSSWYAIPEDINPTNLFKDYYDKMNNLVRNFVPANWTWIIPDWILFPMLFLIFYRIIRH